MIYPFKLKPVYKDYLWGGKRLGQLWGKDAYMDILAESWELSCHLDGLSLIENGIYKGEALKNVLDKNKEFMGTSCAKDKEFPILIKLIDALKPLSVQVHPDDAYAYANEGESGKTEMWYVLDSDEDSFIYYGFNDKITKDEFRKRINDNTLTDVLNKVYVKKGDAVLIKAGTLHAIGADILIAEIQQNSNSTYRIYDYGRIDEKGNKRELHIEKAVDVTVLDKAVQDVIMTDVYTEFDGYSSCSLADNEYFKVEKIIVKTEYIFDVCDKSFKSILCIDGMLILGYNNESMEINKGESVFIPADSGDFCLSGKGEILVSSI